MDKSADAFRTISEVADHLDTPAHVLRFWESRFPQIKPVKRAGGRRYYRPSDVSLLTGIKRLLHDEGMTIRGVQKILREQGVRHVAGILGDAADSMSDDDSNFTDNAAFADQVAAAPTPIKPVPSPFRPAPGLAEAMARVVSAAENAVRPVAPSTVLAATDQTDETVLDADRVDGVAAEADADAEAPSDQPVQGALLLTPSPERQTKVEDGESYEGIIAPVGIESGIAALVRAAQSDAAQQSDALTERSPEEQPAFIDESPDTAEFGDDDFDDGPTATLASRIRSLPQGASASKVGAELMSVVARLHALRDAMADAARTGRV